MNRKITAICMAVLLILLSLPAYAAPATKTVRVGWHEDRISLLTSLDAIPAIPMIISRSCPLIPVGHTSMWRAAGQNY